MGKAVLNLVKYSTMQSEGLISDDGDGLESDQSSLSLLFYIQCG